MNLFTRNKHIFNPNTLLNGKRIEMKTAKRLIKTLGVSLSLISGSAFAQLTDHDAIINAALDDIAVSQSAVDEGAQYSVLVDLPNYEGSGQMGSNWVRVSCGLQEQIHGGSWAAKTASATKDIVLTAPEVSQSLNYSYRVHCSKQNLNNTGTQVLSTQYYTGTQTATILIRNIPEPEPEPEETLPPLPPGSDYADEISGFINTLRASADGVPVDFEYALSSQYPGAFARLQNHQEAVEARCYLLERKNSATWSLSRRYQGQDNPININPTNVFNVSPYFDGNWKKYSLSDKHTFSYGLEGIGDYYYRLACDQTANGYSYTAYKYQTFISDWVKVSVTNDVLPTPVPVPTATPAPGATPQSTPTPTPVAQSTKEPAVTFISPQDNQVLTNSGETVQLNTHIEYYNGATHSVVEYFINNAKIGQSTTANSYSIDWTLPESGGQKIITARATDSYGNQGETSITVNVDTALSSAPEPLNISNQIPENPGTFTLSWKGGLGGDGFYELFECKEESCDEYGTLLYKGGSSGYTQFNKANGDYWYTVRYCRVVDTETQEQACSPLTESLHVQILSRVPLAPKNIGVKTANGQCDDQENLLNLNGFAQLCWEPADGLPYSSRYQVWTKVGLDSWKVNNRCSGAKTSCDYSFATNKRVQFRVQGCNSTGCGAFGETLTVDMAGQPIVYDAYATGRTEGPVYDSTFIGTEVTVSGIGLGKNTEVTVKDISTSEQVIVTDVRSVSATQIRFFIPNNFTANTYKGLVQLDLRNTKTNRKAGYRLYAGTSTYTRLGASSPTIADDGTVYVSVGPKVRAFTSQGSEVEQGWPFDASEYTEQLTKPELAYNEQTLYVGTRNRDIYQEGNKHNYLFALGALNTPYSGSNRWNQPLELEGALAIPVVDHRENIYVGTLGAKFYSITQAGEIRWTYSPGAGVDERATLHGEFGLSFHSIDGNRHYILNELLGPQFSEWFRDDELYPLEDFPFDTDPESISFTNTHPEMYELGRLYYALFGKMPDKNTIAVGTFLIINGVATIEQIGTELMKSPNVLADYRLTDNDEFIDALFKNILDIENALSDESLAQDIQNFHATLQANTENKKGRAIVAVQFINAESYANQLDNQLASLFADFFEFCVNQEHCYASLDSDNDGLPDEWEVNYFGDLTYGPDDDTDNDGVLNSEEFAARTNPDDESDSSGSLSELLGFKKKNISRLIELGEHQFDSSEPVYTDNIGAIQGALSVNSGTASYRYDIPVAPGTNGMMPSMSVAYSSGGGNGLMGDSWSLQGLSSITRCGRSRVIDGYQEAVTWTSKDQFCLNGQRLIEVNEDDRTYFDDAYAREYRTAMDGFSRIVAFNFANGEKEPSHFLVWTKQGEILSYGITDDSLASSRNGKTNEIDGTESFTASWLLSKREDRFGNYVEYNYFKQDFDTGIVGSNPAEEVVEYPFIKSIRYTGNDNAGLTPNSSLEFFYDTKPESQWQLDRKTGLFLRSKLLREVRNMINGEKVSFSRFMYDEAGDLEKPILASITQCGLNNQCLPATTFIWEHTEGVAFSEAKELTLDTLPTHMNGYPIDNLSYEVNLSGRIKTGDFNGDGITDIYQITGTGLLDFDASSSWFAPSIRDKIYFLNSDGQVDSTKDGPISIMTHESTYKESGGRDVNGVSELDKMTALAADSLHRYRFGDFNGDGITDLYRFASNYIHHDQLYLFDEFGNYTEVTGLDDPDSENQISIVSPYQVADWNGFTTSVSILSGLKTGDFNGDGITDFLHVKYSQVPGSKTTKLYLFNEFGKVYETIDGPDFVFDLEHYGEFYYKYESWKVSALLNLSRIKTGDFNNDGITDLYLVRGRMGFPETPKQGEDYFSDRIYLFNHDGVVTEEGIRKGPVTYIDTTISAEASEQIGRVQFGDFNGDGLLDIYQYGQSDITDYEDGVVRAPVSLFDRVYLNSTNGVFLNKIVSSGTIATRASKKWVCQNRGPFCARALYNVHYNVDLNRHYMSDYNRDGKTDIWAQPIAAEHDGPIREGGVYLFDGLGTISDESFSDRRVNGPDTVLPGGATHEPNTWAAVQIASARTRPVDINGDGAIDVMVTGGNPYFDGSNSIYLNQTQRPRIKTITNGLGVQTHIEYGRLTEGGDLYVRHSESAPLDKTKGENSRQGSRLVVKQTQTDDGVGGYSTTQYRYEGLKSHRLFGSLGFAKITATDTHEEGQVSSTEFFQHYPHVGKVKFSSQQTHAGVANGTYLSTQEVSEDDLVVQSTLANTRVGEWGFPFMTYVKGQTTKNYSYENPSEVLTTATSSSQVDTWGNQLRSESQVTDAYGTYTSITENAYDDERKELWLLGRLTSSSATKTIPGDSQTNTTESVYATDSHALTDVTVEPGTDLATTVHSDYDSYGNVVTIATCGGDSCSASSDNARITMSEYDDRGQFVVRAWNVLDQEIRTEYDYRFGLPTTSWDLNNQKTCMEYDDLGRVKKSIAFCDSSAEVVTYTDILPASGEVGDSALPLMQIAYKVRQHVENAADVTTYFDAFERAVRTETDTPNQSGPRLARLDTQFDERGRAIRVSEPYYENDMPLWNATEFDALNRIVTLYPADGYNPNTHIYNGLTERVEREVDGEIRFTATIKNGLGQTIEIIDAHEESLQYFYTAAGLLESTLDAEGNAITLTYDNLGRKLEMDDPDMGEWSYTYTEFGELETQTDAKNATTFMAYDALGRMKTRIFDYGTSNAKTETWSYDTADNGLGLLHTISNDEGYEKRFNYDSFNRIEQVDETIEAKNFSTSYEYDGLHRIDVIHYPAGLSIQNHFDTNTGTIKQVTSLNGDTNYWTLEETNARGQIVRELMAESIQTERDYRPGNGWLNSTTTSFGSNTLHNMSYTFNDVGSLTSRTNGVINKTETFAYDRLDRLTGVTLDGNTTSYTYDALGNITSKSDVGDYTEYGTKAGSCTYTPGPHAVSKVDGPQGGKFCYDQNGNLATTQLANGVWQQVKYNAENRPIEFLNSDEIVAQFAYSPLGNRYKKWSRDAGLTYYVGQDEVGKTLYEQTDAGIEGVKHTHYIYAGGLSVATVREVVGGTKAHAQRVEYQLRDHLNSIEVFVDKDGNRITENSFDASGRPRNANDWSALGDFEIMPLDGKRGYTDHEHIDENGLIHMNGRVYNPILGRFLTPDPTIPFAKVQQSYNRYSYVRNNPLRYTDPTGFTEESVEEQEELPELPEGFEWQKNADGRNVIIDTTTDKEVVGVSEFRDGNGDVIGGEITYADNSSSLVVLGTVVAIVNDSDRSANYSDRKGNRIPKIHLKNSNGSPDRKAGRVSTRGIGFDSEAKTVGKRGGKGGQFGHIGIDFTDKDIPSWGTSDFLIWYIGGDGEGKLMWEMGVRDEFLDNQQTKDAVNALKTNMAFINNFLGGVEFDFAGSHIMELQGHNPQGWYPYQNIFDPLFSFGTGFLHVNASCRAGTCQAAFNYWDRFSDIFSFANGRNGDPNDTLGQPYMFQTTFNRTFNLDN